MNRVDEIEYMLACNELTAAQVFTQMRQLIPNKNIEAERDALKRMLDIAWDAVHEAGYQDFSHELRDFMEGEG